MSITPLYAALLALLLMVLSLRTIKLRREHKIAIGHGDNKAMERAMRAHANFTEYVPFTLLLIYMLETLTKSALLIHALCLSLIVGRVIHAYNISQLNEKISLRVIGMLLTFAALTFSALGIIVFTLF